MKLLLDMNMSPQWVNMLANNNIKAEHWINIGSANDLDIEIMEFARKNDYIILTHDLDFGMMLALTHCEKPSVIQLRNGDLFLDDLVKLVVIVLEKYQQELEEGALITIDALKTRVRVLPF